MKRPRAPNAAETVQLEINDLYEQVAEDRLLEVFKKVKDYLADLLNVGFA